MYWFHSNFAELYITIKHRSSSILVIIPQILAELWPFFDLVFVGVLILVSDNNFCRDALILLKVCRRIYHCKIQVRKIYHCKIQVKFDSNRPQNFGWVMVLFRLSFCWCVAIDFRSITFAGMHWFYWKFAEGYIIVKYRSSSILVIFRKVLANLWPFFNLVFCVGVKHKVKILLPLNNFWRDAFHLKFAEWYFIIA